MSDSFLADLCAALTPQIAQTYVLQYDFFADERCSIRVLQESTAPDGSLQLDALR